MMIEIKKLNGLERVPNKLYVKGNTELLSKPALAIAGSRKITEVASKAIKEVISNEDRTIVSGLALGADTIAHEEAIKNGLGTIAVLPSGFDLISPPKNRGLAKEILDNGGLLVSKYPPKTPGSPARAIYRNRIIAGLGDELFVPQCKKNSGTMHTVRFADMYQRPIKTWLPKDSGSEFSGNRYILNNFDAYSIKI